MALVCDTCNKQWAGPGQDQGCGWWRLEHHMVTTHAAPLVRDERDFCSEACIRVFYAGARDGAPTQRLTTAITEMERPLPDAIRKGW